MPGDGAATEYGRREEGFPEIIFGVGFFVGLGFKFRCRGLRGLRCWVWGLGFKLFGFCALGSFGSVLRGFAYYMYGFMASMRV